MPQIKYTRDAIAGMEGYTPGFQPADVNVIKLNTNENPYPPSPRAIEAMREACGESLRRYPQPLADRFRHAAAEVFGLGPEMIICGFGSDDLLTIAVRTFCEKGDTIAFPHPSYSLYETLARIQGARSVAVDFPEDYSLPPALLQTGAALTLLANPNAPSGTLIPRAEVERLAAGLDGILLVDEAYVDFADEHCLELVKRFDNVVVTRTLSKSYSLAGLRFGFAAADARLVEQMMKVKDSYNVSAPGIAGAVAAIEDRQWLARNVGRIKRTRARLMDGLAELGFDCRPSQTNFVLAKVPRGADAGTLFEQLFEKKILVRYFDLPRLDDCLRITIGTDAETERLLDALNELIHPAGRR